MSDLIVVAYPDEATALEMRTELMRMQRESLTEMDDVAVVTREPGGDVQLQQA